MAQVQGVGNTSQEIQRTLCKYRNVLQVYNDEEHQANQRHTDSMSKIMHQRCVEGSQNCKVRNVPGELSIMTVHEEHHAQTKERRMFRNRSPHNHLRCSTERSLRVEKQTQSRTDNRPGKQNRSQLPTVNLSLPDNQVQGDHHVELQFNCQRPVHLIHVIHTQEALQHRCVD